MIKEYPFRVYGYVNIVTGKEDRLAKEGVIYASSIAEAKQEAKVKAGCASLNVLWRHETGRVNYWAFDYKTIVRVELFTSPQALHKMPLTGGIQNGVYTVHNDPCLAGVDRMIEPQSLQEGLF